MTARKTTPREHGTHNCYVHGPDRRYTGRGCRYTPCRAANATYERERARRKAPPFVDAAEARRHVRWLGRQGVGLKTIAKTAGVSTGTLSKLVYGIPKTGRPPSKRIRPKTASKILAVMPTDIADGGRVDAAQTWANIDELRSRGWSKRQIARAIGQNSQGLQLAATTVTAGNARAIAALLEQPVPACYGRTEPPEPEAPTDDHERAVVPLDPLRLLLRERPDLPHELLHRGACRHDDVPNWIFYATEDDHETISAAKAICETCPVRDACLDYAVASGERWGIWGGRTAEERHELAVPA